MSNSKKKIAFVYDAIFPFIKGGAEKRFYEIGKRLSATGYEVHLYGMKSWNGENVIEHEGLTLHGICKNYPMYTDSGRRSIFEAVMFGLSTFKLISEDFDVIDCCGFPFFSLFPLRVISWIKRVPFYSTWHEVWGFDYWVEYLGILGVFGYVIEQIAVFLPDTIISVSQMTTENITSKLFRKRNVVTIVNGLEVSRFRNIKSSTNSSHVFYAGRLLSNKNVDILIKSANLLKEKISDLKMVIVGDGPERKKLEKLSEDLGLLENVFFTGFIENTEELYSLMQASRVFVLPSSREGFGMVVLEANACGLPVVTVNHPNNASQYLISNNNNGIVCDLNEKDLSVSIEDLIKTRKDNTFYRGYVEKYDWENIMKSIKKIYFL